MKKLIAILIVLVLATKSFSQTSDYDYTVTLGPTESFIKLSSSQIVDTLSMNQTGPEEFRYFRIHINKEQVSGVDLFMKECKSTASILNKYGRTCFDVVFESNSDIIRPLSGFYYAIDEDKYEKGKFYLIVAHPL
jgi:hypothetical protein